jgi:ATP-binding cassette, subfamily B, bacterial PglK
MRVQAGLTIPAMSKKSGTKNREESARELARVAYISWTLLTKKEKFYFSIRVAVRMALNGLDIVAVGLMGLLGAITALGLSGQNLEIFGFAIPSPTATNVIALVGAVAVLFILKGALAIIFTRWTSIFLANVEIKNSAKIARHLFSGSLGQLKKYSRAQIQYLVTTSTNAAFSGILGALTTVIIDVFLFVSIFVMFLVVDWIAALMIAGYFALLILILQMATGRRYLASGRVIQRSSIGGDSAILEMVDGYREIAVLSKQDFFLTRFIEAKKDSARTGVTLQILKSLPRYIGETGLIVGALLFVIWQLNRGSLGEGLLALGVFLAGSFRMMGAILPLQSIWNDLKTKQAWVVMAQEVLVKLRDEPERLDSRLYATTSVLLEREFQERSAGGFGVEISGVTYTHIGKDQPAVHNVSLSVPPGGYAAIVGPSGAGKTTLVDLLLGLHDPQGGEVTIDGVDPRVLREQSPGLLSYVPQRPGLVSGSIAHNVALGVPDHEIDEDAVLVALQKAQLGPLIETIPGGIHASLGSHSDSLSGGQIQRLGLARALYTNPRLIILDEATSALDAATEASIAQAIHALGGDTTVIVIAHRLSTIQHADTVFVMDDAKIVASGTFKEIRKKVPMIEEYVRLMSFDND